MRLAAPQKTIYNSYAKDGTRLTGPSSLSKAPIYHLVVKKAPCLTALRG
jgi:hypothetical protein